MQKKGGGYLYATTDLAAIQYRQKELGGDYLMYFVDARQSLHFEQIFTLARKAKFIGVILKLSIMDSAVMGKDGRLIRVATVV